MAESKRETEHKQEYEHGEELEPAQKLCDVAGWLYKPKEQPQYDGENQPWRR